MEVWNVLHVACWKYMAQNSPSACHRTTFLGCIFATKACIDSRKKKTCWTAVSPPHVPTVRWTSAHLRLRSVYQFGAPSKFQRVSHVGFVTAPTSLNGGQLNFVWCLAVSLAGTLYIHFQGLLLLREFCQVQNSLCLQVLRYPVLAALLCSTRVVSVMQTLRHGIFTRQDGHPMIPFDIGWSNCLVVIIITKLTSVCLCGKSHHFKTANVNILSTHSIHRC